MRWLWTWGGRFFGYREGDELWTYDGRHVSRLIGDEVYGPSGRYLGEIMQGRLITSLNKTSWMRTTFAPHGSRIGYVPFLDYVGYVMILGYEEFLKLEAPL